MGNIQYNDPVLNAVSKFEDDGYTYGSIIPKIWFDECFGISVPTTIAQAEAAKMLYARYMGELRTRLLIGKKMALRTKDGFGQEVVMPSEQAEWAQQEASAAIVKELERAKDRLVHINTEMLTAEEERERTDALNRLAALQRQGLRRLK